MTIRLLGFSYYNRRYGNDVKGFFRSICWNVNIQTYLYNKQI